ncbi:hypothetical protein PVAND_002247 [Polypedilum vanderplanki]|uniref:CARD domain-containing protein n=1 Tax=Polypedilum vanderplanki TaxID=319348 RepID=A0A9J6BQE6_POLVA|nr:hypothetical protein PVAND_002247 [Polypedilum vanderplanki]
MTTDHTQEISDLLTKYKSIIIQDLLTNKAVLQSLVEETVIDKNDLEFLLAIDDNENENSLYEKKCQYLIDTISKEGLKCFKKFCYTIESECKVLIAALINDSLNNGKKILSIALKCSLTSRPMFI